MLKSLILLLLGGGLLLLAVMRLRRYRLKERYALIFLLLGLPFFALAAWPNAVGRIADVLDMDDHRGIGLGWVHDIDLEPTGDGSISFAARALYESELIPLAANASSKAAGRIDQASLVASDKTAADAAVVGEVTRMRAALREYVAERRD
jgi:hypothetical protein